MGTVNNAIISNLKTLVNAKVKNDLSNANDEALILELTKATCVKSQMVAFDEDDDSIALTKAEAKELVLATIAEVVEEKQAAKKLAEAGAKASTEIAKIASQVVNGGKDMDEATGEVAELLGGETELASKLLAKAIEKEEAKIAFADTKAKRFIRLVGQIIKDESLNDTDKMENILSATRARYTPEQLAAIKDSLEAEAKANEGKQIFVSREDGTSYAGVIKAVVTTGGQIAYRVQSEDSIIYSVSVAQRLGYDIIEPTEEEEAEA